MAYRFLLEVPEADRKAAEIVVGAVPETQIVVTRSSYSAGIDTPRAALTISSHSLRVIDAIYQWYSSAASSPDVHLVLYSGERLPLSEHSPGSIVAAIRADQPWVEHAIPRIGDHIQEETVTAAAQGPGVGVASRPREITIDHVNFIAINVMDLRRAEAFYTDFFDMEIVGRSRSRVHGTHELVSDDYDWEQAIATETPADDSYLRNDKLVLALHRAGVGARLDRSIIDRISIQVDAASYNRLKAKVLVNGYGLLGESQASFTFRDPFGVPWEIGMAGLLPHILREALGS